MSQPFLSIGRLSRTLSSGQTESLVFLPGVNLLVGSPNTGKTKWLQTLDHLLGDPASFDATFDEQLFAKYDSASVELLIGDESLSVERRWKEPGGKTKIFVNDEAMPAREFQHLLLEKLGIPLLHFPKGNPLSGQTWPELSFRMLLRHIYRQQRFWGGIADMQPEAEQHACLLQFLGLAEHIYTDDYGELVAIKLAAERLAARREQYGSTLDELAGDLLTEDGREVKVTTDTVAQAEKQLERELDEIGRKRTMAISDGRDRAVPPQSRGRVEELSERRAVLIVEREHAFKQARATQDRLDEMRRYRVDLNDELGRLRRAEDAGAVFADLKITHCPACDQTVAPAKPDDDTHCHLCHQILPGDPVIEGLGATRLRFESDRLNGELAEADTLLDVLEREAHRLVRELSATDEQLRMVENELAPARHAVAALVSEEISAIDMTMGELSERQRQVKRLKGALELGDLLTEQIRDLENQIAPLQVKVDEKMGLTDFGAAEEELAAGMGFYLSELNRLKPGVWRHSEVDVNLSRTGFSIKIGSRRWNTTLGGTDTLYFLMAYHFGLLWMSDKIHGHYPGLSIIDLPGDFLGESIEDKENFIVQPFIDLLRKESFSGAQVIITGASFQGLGGANRTRLDKVFLS